MRLWLFFSLVVCFLVSPFVTDNAGAQSGQGGTIEGAEQYYSANALYNRKLYDLAIKEYEAFLSAKPAHAATEKARLGAALCYYSSGKYKQAADYLGIVIAKKQEGDVNQLSVLRGQSLLKLNNLKDAEGAFALPASSAGKFQAVALSGLADAQFRQSKWAEAVKTSGRFLKLDDKSDFAKRAFYQGAYSNYQLKNYTEAIPLFQRLSAISPADPNRYQSSFILAECYREVKDLPSAVEQYKIASSGIKGKQLAAVYYRLGFVYFSRSEFPACIASLEKSIASDPKSDFSSDCRLYVGRAKLEEKDFSGAEKELKALSGQSASAALWLGRVYSRQKKYNEAARVLKTAVTAYKTDALYPDLSFDYANALVVSGKYAEALAPLAELYAQKGFSQRNDVLRLYAVCLHRTDDYSKSLQVATEFASAYPKDKLLSEIAFVQAENLYLLNKLPEAVAAYKKFIAANADHPNVDAATYRLAQVSHRQSRWADVITLTSMLVQSPPKGEIYNQLHFIVGNSCFRLEKWKPAVNSHEAFLAAHADRRQKEPNVDSALAQIGVASSNQGKPDKSAKAFKDIVKEFPKSAHRALAYSELGRMQYESEDYAAAASTLSGYLSAFAGTKQPQDAQVRYYLGWTALATNNLAGAEKHFGVVVNTYPNHALAVDSSLQLGLMKLRAGQHDKASAILSALLAKSPAMPRKLVAMFSLGMALSNQKQWAQAEPWFKKVVQTDPKSEFADRAVYELAWCAKGTKKKGQAIKQYKDLLKNYPESKLAVKVKIELAELTFDAKNYDEVITQLEQTLTQIKDKKLREETSYRLCTAYYNKGDHEKSAAGFEAFIAEHPGSALIANAEFHAGESRLKLKETVLARDHFLAASALQVKNTANQKTHLESTLMRLGETQGMTQQWKESAETYSRFAKEFSGSKWIIRARFGMAWAYERQGELEHALQEYRRVVAAGRKDDMAARSQFQIGECLFAQKKYSEAILELVRVDVNYKNKDWSPKAALEIGRVLEAKGDAKGAMDSFKEVMKRYPEHDVAVVAKERVSVLRRKM